jgi:hypothetical protein
MSSSPVKRNVALLSLAKHRPPPYSILPLPMCRSPLSATEAGHLPHHRRTSEPPFKPLLGAPRREAEAGNHRCRRLAGPRPSSAWSRGATTLPCPSTSADEVPRRLSSTWGRICQSHASSLLEQTPPVSPSRAGRGRGPREFLLSQVTSPFRRRPRDIMQQVTWALCKRAAR